MMQAMPASPLGTARVAYQSQPTVSPLDAALEPLLDSLRNGLRLYNLDEEIVTLAREVARWESGLEPVDQRALFLLVLVSLVARRQGSTRLPVLGQEGREWTTEILENLLAECAAAIDPARAYEEIEHLLKDRQAGQVIGGPESYKPLILESAYLYHQKLFRLEQLFVENILRRLVRRPPLIEVKSHADYWQAVQARPAVLGGKTIAFNAEQQHAVLTSLRSGFTVILGEPGSGKTTIVVAILRMFARLGVNNDEIVLAAPTGKAAHRLGQAAQQGLRGIAEPEAADLQLLELAAPRTLHRLLGYSPATDKFYHHQNNRVQERVVIVDEASMIDLFLMERLLRSLRDDALLVLLGDAGQLPSVDAGAVLRDLTMAGLQADALAPINGHTVTLTQSHRMDPRDPSGRNILAIARRIRAGQVAEMFSPGSVAEEGIAIRANVSELLFDKVEFLGTESRANELQEFLFRWYDEHFAGNSSLRNLLVRVFRRDESTFVAGEEEALGELFGHVDRSRILCLTRVYQTGADWINSVFHERWQESVGAGPGADYIAGEPIMMLVNDYERQIFNGDQGLVLNVAADGKRPQHMAVFPRADGFGIFPVASLSDRITHSFALTVHKSQGSEFRHVAVILPDEDLPINTREIHYTALTRSKKSVTIVGKQAIFEAGVRRQVRRSSGIAARLLAPT